MLFASALATSPAVSLSEPYQAWTVHPLTVTETFPRSHISLPLSSHVQYVSPSIVTLPVPGVAGALQQVCSEPLTVAAPVPGVPLDVGACSVPLIVAYPFPGVDKGSSTRVIRPSASELRFF